MEENSKSKKVHELFRLKLMQLIASYSDARESVGLYRDLNQLKI